MKPADVADSTIGFTLYNWLAVHLGHPATMGDILVGLRQLAQDQITADRALRVLQAMLERGLLVERPNEINPEAGPRFDIPDPGRWKLRKRNRSGGGWDGWVVECPRSGLRLHLMAAVARNARI